jgi:hypothetical protein
MKTKRALGPVASNSHLPPHMPLDKSRGLHHSTIAATMKFSNIVFAGISLLIAPAAGQLAAFASWRNDHNYFEPIGGLYVTGGCISFGARAANYVNIPLGIRCRFYR